MRSLSAARLGKIKFLGIAITTINRTIGPAKLGRFGGMETFDHAIPRSTPRVVLTRLAGRLSPSTQHHKKYQTLPAPVMMMMTLLTMVTQQQPRMQDEPRQISARDAACGEPWA